MSNISDLPTSNTGLQRSYVKTIKFLSFTQNIMTYYVKIMFLKYCNITFIIVDTIPTECRNSVSLSPAIWLIAPRLRLQGEAVRGEWGKGKPA